MSHQQFTDRQDQDDQSILEYLEDNLTAEAVRQWVEYLSDCVE